MKRHIDFLGALLGLVILAIPFTVVALAIKLDSKSSVFFRQERKSIRCREREYVENHHDISVLADKLMECIEQVMNDGERD